ncbi:hypothetical protein HMI55_005528 [Coelomomyces lativittatus]|nr:hypothetical protein HMI55_005528 [Coelomomyces lativittatus]
MQPSSFISHLSSFTTPSLTSHASPVGFNEHEEYTMQWKHHLETTGMSTISLDQTHDQELKEDDDDEVEEEEAHEEWMEQDELLALRNLPRLIKNHEKDMDKEEIFKLPWEQKKVRDGGGVLPLSRSSFSFSTQVSKLK